MEQPYVLTKLHKSTSTSDLNVFAGRTIVGSRTSSREAVIAVDSQGVNVFNIRSNQVANSYSLSPSTKFQCSPVSCVDRLLSVRRTYAALQTGIDDMKVQCWTETNLDSDTEVTTHATKVPVASIHVLSGCVLLLYTNGDLERLSLSLGTVFESVPGSAYLGQTKGNVLLANATSRLEESEELELHLVFSVPDGIKIYHIKVSTSGDSDLDKEPSFYVDDIKLRKKIHQPQAQHFALGDAAQLAIAIPSASHTDVLYYNKLSAEPQSIKITHAANSNVIPTVHLKWLNPTQFLFIVGTYSSIWDISYKTCQSSLTLKHPCSLLTIIPQRTSSTSSSTSGATLVMATNTDIYLSQASFTKQMTLMSAIGKQARSKKEKESWLQDIPIQSTWKDSISTITQEAKSCLSALENAKTGNEIDAILEEFLFPDPSPQGKSSKRSGKGLGELTNGMHKGGKTPSNKSDQPITKPGLNRDSGILNGYAPGPHDKTSEGDDLDHAESEDEEKQLMDVLEREVKDQVYPVLESFASYETTVSLSVPFITSLLRIIFVKSPANKEKQITMFPSATIDFLLKKGLLSLSSLSRAGVALETLVKDYPDLRSRLVKDVSGLLPIHYISILQSFLAEPLPAKRLISAVLSKLDNFDEALVVDAIRGGLQQEQILSLLQLLSDELQERLEESYETPSLTISDETACASITALMDSFGISNIMFSKASLELISSLRVSMARLISQHESIGTTDCCVGELLMKARLLETTSRPKALVANATHVPSNPEPEARRGEMPLDKVKRVEKGQTQRAKAQARVQGIGSLYTIETLQI